MDKHHIQELRAAFNRALSEMAAVAESGAMPYEVRAAAMQAHISIAAKARETIAHLHTAITPSGVSGTTVKGADLVAMLDKQAKRISNATALGIVNEFKSGPGEHLSAAPNERPDNEHTDAANMGGTVKASVCFGHVMRSNRRQDRELEKGGNAKAEETDSDAATYDYTYTDANGVIRDHAGLEVISPTQVKAEPQHTEKFANAAMPAGATVTHKWDKS